MAIDIRPVADKPNVELTITASESNGSSSTTETTLVNGGSGQPGGFDVQNGQIVKVGDGVRVWLTKGDPVPEIANPDSGNPGVVEFYSDGNPHGSSDYADIFVVHPDSGWFYTQSDWGGAEELRDLNSVLGGTVSQQSSDAMKDYIFLSGDTAGFDVGFGPNNRNGNFNTIDSIVVKYDNETLISGSNQIEGVIYGNGTLGGPNKEDTTTKTVSGSQEFLVDVSAELTDTDGSETLSGIALTGIPDGVNVELVEARDGVTLTHGDTGWVISNPDGKDLTGIQLKVTVTQNSDEFTIRAEATSTEKVGGGSALGFAAANFVDTDTVPTITVDDDGLAKLNVSTDDSDLRAVEESVSSVVDFSSVFGFDYGTDGRGDVTYEIILEDSSVATGFTMSKTGDAISLSLDDGKLIGLTGSGVKVFEVTLDADGKVSMTQYEAVSHPDGTQDNEEISLANLGVKLQVTVTDADGNTSEADTATTKIDLGAHLKFEDDGISISQNSVPEEGYHVSTEGVTQVVTGSYSFAVAGAAWSPSDSANSGHAVNGSIYQADGFTIQAIGFDANGNLTQAQVFQTDYRGLSVYSPDASSSIKELPSEISVRNGKSEEIIFKLEPGHLAFGINAQLSSLFIGGEQGDTDNEIATAVFYRNGEEVGSTTNFIADSSGGHLTTDLTSIPGGFDEVRFVAVDNGTGSSNASNSDFAIQSISFVGADSTQPIASATGQVDANSADGVKGFELSGLVDNLGYTVTLSDNNHTLLAVDADNKPVFEIKMSEGTGKWDVLQYQEMTKDIQFTVKAVDNDGDSVTTVVSLGTEHGNSAPELTFVDGSDSAVISEEGLAAGNQDTDGDSDTTNSVTASGVFTISDVDSSDTLTVSLVAPTDVMKSDGVVLAWTTDSSGNLVAKAGDTEIIRVALTDTEGQHGYVVTLSGPVDHADPKLEDTASINFGIAVNDGTVTTTESVSVIIEDDSPNAVTTAAELTLSNAASESNFAIDGISVDFKGADFSYGRSWSREGVWDADGDGDQDGVYWGAGFLSSNKSGSYYSTTESSASVGVGINSSFVVGEFTHKNDILSGNDATLKSATMSISFNITIAGEVKSISLDVPIVHKETSNNGTSDDDTVILTPASQNVEVNGVTYTVTLDGFRAGANDEITQYISTPENRTEAYSIVASVEVAGSSDLDSNVLNGSVEFDAGADGLDKVVADTTTNDNGTFVTSENGTYVFTASAALIGSLEKDDSKVVSYEYTVVDKDGDSVVNTINITVFGPGTERVNTAPELTFVDGSDSAVISEEGLADGNPDTDGDSDTTNSVTASGVFTISDVDSSDTLTVSLVAPTDVMKSDGVVLVWTTDSSGNLVAKAGDAEIIRVALTDTEGQHGYVVTLSGPVDHTDKTSEDNASINFGIAVNDGTVTTTEGVSVVIEDDSPNAVTTTADLTLGNSSFSIGDILVNFNNADFTNGSGNTGVKDLDSDGGKDLIYWGADSKDAPLEGSYYSTSESTLAGGEVNSSFVVGQFTHNNTSLDGGSKSLETVTMSISFDITIEGVDKTIELDVPIAHDETSNNGSSDDTVNLTSVSQTVEVNGVTYKVALDGFRAGNNGEITQHISTPENSSETYSIVASVRVDNTNDSNVLKGSVELDAGADGLDKVLEDTTTDSHGTFVTNANGTYVFTASAALIGSLAKDESKVVSYEYTVVDKDGDSIVNTMNITVYASGEMVAESSSSQPDEIARVSAIASSSKDETSDDTAADDSLIGGAGDSGSSTGDDSLIGGAGDSSSTSGSSTGDDSLIGGAGDSSSTSGSSTGDDSLIGGAGDSSSTSGSSTGDDSLIGGSDNGDRIGTSGQDRFVLDDDSNDTITDFNTNDDILDLTDLLSSAEDSPGADASEDAIADFLKDHVSKDSSSSLTVSDGSGHGATVNLDSASSADSIKVIYNDHEYNINIDG
ncbi:hypothetical protein KDW99_08095 [Marinomonas rhizomae]|uniref:DUF5801 repeats-in-toxin domain-containing protein n=1 Tax=Marinomonas rhizomae TaxID=491948 RepID=UPI0021068F41|nr:DUF5801 repeats-in-toxin domain-containing protein [Marinomonas rhizomae]UTW01075.1 hypothetical protein KDW99_08095 [Marinomonas rhizomae]